jgi:NADH:ubiquinone reductase (non-electrogenic)
MNRPRLLILGSGFGAFSLLRRVDLRGHDVTVVSPRNHFLFTPLLPSTTVGTVEFRTIIEPVRTARRGIRFHLGSAESIDFQARLVRCRGADSTAWEQPYDLLVIAAGCVTNTFGVPGVTEHACFLKELADARLLRQRLIDNLERASLPGTSEETQARLVHFVAVGAGPTGVRFAAELYDLLASDLPRSYPHLVAKARVTLLDAGKSLLPAYEEPLREYVAQVFFRRGIVVRTQSPVKEVGPAGVRLADGEVLPSGLVLWCAGFAPSPLVAGLAVEKDRAGRIVTDECLQVHGRPGVYALGDCACPRGQNLPQLAQVAEQQGAYLAEGLGRRARGQPVRPFEWRNRGISSYIGRGSAVVAPHEGPGRMGFWAYQQWRGAIWTGLVSWKNKLLVPLDRLRAFAFGRDLSKF